MPKNSKYQFFFEESGRRMACPNCHEAITPPDVEVYPVCPYCNTPFPSGVELEDFIIDPLIRHWENKCVNHGMPGGR